MKYKMIWVILLSALGIGLLLAANAQTTNLENNVVVTVKNTVKDMMGNTVVVEDLSFVNGVSCSKSWWDFAHKIQKVSNETGVVNFYSIRDGVETLIGQYTFDGNDLKYTHYQIGAVLRYFRDPYNGFQLGQTIPFVENDTSTELLDVAFVMGSDFPWSGCSQFKFESGGGIKVVPVETSTMMKECGTCTVGSPCSTICMKDPQYWTNQNKNRARVFLFGVNSGNAVAGSSNAVKIALTQGMENGFAAAIQLNLQIGAVPPVTPGRPECYGVAFEEFTLSSGMKISPQTDVNIIVQLMIAAIKENNFNDFQDIVNKAVKPIVLVRNC